MSNNKLHLFCETPEEKCTMNYCDENGCINRKRNLVGESIEISNNKQIKTHLTTATILIALLLLCWAIAKIDAIFYSVLALSVLGMMYAFIYLTIIRNQGGNNEQQ